MPQHLPHSAPLQSTLAAVSRSSVLTQQHCPAELERTSSRPERGTGGEVGLSSCHRRKAMPMPIAASCSMSSSGLRHTAHSVACTEDTGQHLVHDNAQVAVRGCLSPSTLPHLKHSI